MSNEKLLEDLAQKRGCFISSLRGKEERKKTAAALLEMPLEDYPVKGCAASLKYLFGENVQAESYDEIRAFIKMKL